MRIALTLVLLLPLPAAAQDCDTAETQVALTACANGEWMAADADLNANYATAIKAMAGVEGGTAALRQAQRAWIAYRDAACAAEALTVQGGSAEPMVYGFCMARLTTARAEDLAILYEME